jgi:hypothetical protein
MKARWLEDVENDLQELKVKIWRQKANNTKEYVCDLKETGVLKGHYNHGVNKQVNP